ncbi:HugZ family protein [Dinoroseobacter sp. S76]|uniref:HugZ family pyridoxamine 5'-phosphate oxidase n=1 Tax=Dinoroseobacter sp. S76 TaxID=3415124 RepID=UPI003C7EC7BE
MADKINPIRPTDDDARRLARGLIAEARFGALGTVDPETGGPMVTRVAVGTAPDGRPLTLISELSLHTKALSADPRCSLLLGEPGPKGDPLTHPRITLQMRAGFVKNGTPAYAALREHYLTTHPKAQLYIDFTDFHFALFEVQSAALNGGFGKAFALTPTDLGLNLDPD